MALRKMGFQGSPDFGQRSEQEMGDDCQTELRLERVKEEDGVIEPGCIMEFPRWEEAEPVKKESGEWLSQRWEVQWQELLKTVESSHVSRGVPQLAEGGPTPWDDAKAFLASFEQVAEACQWPKDEWVTRLLPVLQEEAERAFEKLRDREDYRNVNAAILGDDALREEKQHQHFQHFCYQEAEGPQEAYRQLQGLCHQWLKAERQTKEQILETLILEQFLTVLPQKMQSWVRGNRPETYSQAVTLAEDFLQRQQVKEKQKQQMPGLFEEQVVDCSEAEQTLLDTEVRPACRQIKMEASFLVCQEVNGNKQHSLDWESSEKMEVHCITQEEAEQNFSQRWVVGDGTVNECSLVRMQVGKLDLQTEDCQPRGPAQSKHHKGPALHPGSPKGKGKNVCMDCGKSFQCNSRLVVHRRVHTGERPYKCSLCGKDFRRNAHLYQHHRVHTGEKPYQCADCGSCFNDKSTFLKHRRIHTGEKPYKCDSCGKSFVQSSNLSRHQRIHNEDKL